MRFTLQEAPKWLFLACLPLAAWALAAPSLRLPSPPGWLLPAALVLLLVSLALSAYTRGAVRRTLPLLGGTEAARTEKGPGGFEWYPAGQPVPYVHGGIGVRHAWLDAEKGQHVISQLSFELSDLVPPRTLENATRKALKAAVRALPARGKVQAKGDFQDVPGPTARVRVRLDIRGFGADQAWAQAASRAFAQAFLDRLQEEGWTLPTESRHES